MIDPAFVAVTPGRDDKATSPATIAATAQFASLYPVSATYLVKALG